MNKSKWDGSQLPVIGHATVRAALKDLYGIEATIEALDGERDKNFRVWVGQSAPVEQFVFKVANLAEDLAMLECQEQVFSRLQEHGVTTSIVSIKSAGGHSIEKITGDDGSIHFCRLTCWMDGDLFSRINPQNPQLLESLGQSVAAIDLALVGFDHAALKRPLLWQMENCLEVIDRFRPLLLEPSQVNLIEAFYLEFVDRVNPISHLLRRSAIHNDANDNNVIVSDCGPWDQQVTGLIDFGDMVYSWTVVDLAVACAYAILDKAKPLDTAFEIIRGYHGVHPLSPMEIQALFPMIAMRLCMSVCICAYQKSLDPDNQYLTISEQPAWRTLQRLSEIPADFAHFLFRDSCGLPPVPTEPVIESWLRNHKGFHSLVKFDLSNDSVLILDTSVSSPSVDFSSDYDPVIVTRDLFRAIGDADARAGIGRYNEYRLIYNSDDFIDFSGNRRTLHLGIDVFQPAGSPVFAPLAGSVFSLANNDAPLDYGGTIILQHEIPDREDGQILFYTLYGHLAPESFSNLAVGSEISPGQQIATMGDIHQNGNWPPHVHFEIITNILGETSTFVGVGTHAHRNVWLSLCPNPNLILRIPEEKIGQPLSDIQREPLELFEQRRKYLSPSLSLSYNQPIVMARACAQYMYDASGKRYLDAVNNVPHVGHCHPEVVAAAESAATVLNTNTRYLYPSVTDYAERLLTTFPDPLGVVFLVNSGSEANDLALRLARCYTNRHEIIVLDHAYHGNLSALIGLSPYKHDGPGGGGTPDWVHKVVMPDGYRGQYRYNEPDYGLKYTKQIASVTSKHQTESNIAGFFSESILGCGGQVMLPQGYLTEAYRLVRDIGGVCIADEVQTGFGRVGTHFWAYQTQEVVPDIVTLGKPAGNGHPLAAVVTTREIADSFYNGMEYFNTFGGNPVSCAIGCAVLNVIEKQNLQFNALETGNYLIQQLTSLASRFALIGEVRGSGLFIGVELVNDQESLEPAAQQASYIAERMKQEGILISTDGPYHNVLKIKPPLVFNKSNAEQLVATLEIILGENWSAPSQEKY